MTKKKAVQWCYWQSKCSDFDGFACMASSASGHVFECSFCKDGQWVDRGMLNGKKRRSPIHPEGGGVCEDYMETEHV
jgi:hypothetical protein